jgi:hypothetical protein
MTSVYIIDDYLIKLQFDNDNINIECIDNKMNKFSKNFNDGASLKLPFNLKNIYKIICDKLKNKDVIITNSDDSLQIEFNDKEFEINFYIILEENNKLLKEVNEKLLKQNLLIIKLQDNNLK